MGRDLIEVHVHQETKAKACVGRGTQTKIKEMDQMGSVSHTWKGSHRFMGETIYPMSQLLHSVPAGGLPERWCHSSHTSLSLGLFIG